MAVAWGALVALTVSTLTGRLLPQKEPKEEAGLWGFNGILVGCALMTFLKPSPLVWALLVLGAAGTVWLREGMNRLMSQWRINPLTMPFVLIAWIMLAASREFGGISPEGLPHPAFVHAESSSVATGPVQLFLYWLRGIAQVFLIDSSVSGLFFLAGLVVANGWSAFWAALASALSLAAALLLGASGAEISAGLYGYSPVLTGIALGSIFYHPSWRSALWTLLGILFTVVVQAAANTLFTPFGLPSLTAPFCLVTWIFLLPMFRFDKNQKADHTDWSPQRKRHLRPKKYDYEVK